jgi:hypothetical protein
MDGRKALRAAGGTGRKKEAPELGSAQVAENRLGAAGEYGCHPQPFATQAWVPDGVDTSMNAVQALLVEAAAASPPADAGFLQLLHRDNPVLLRGEAGDECFRSFWGAFPTHLGR